MSEKLKTQEGKEEQQKEESRLQPQDQNGEAQNEPAEEQKIDNKEKENEQNQIPVTESKTEDQQSKQVIEAEESSELNKDGDEKQDEKVVRGSNQKLEQKQKSISRSMNKSKSKSRSKNGSKNNKQKSQADIGQIIQKDDSPDNIKEDHRKSPENLKSPKSTKSQKIVNQIRSKQKSRLSINNEEQEDKQLIQKQKQAEQTQKPKLIPQITSVRQQGYDNQKVQKLELMMDEKLRQIKQLKQELKKEKQKNKILSIELSAIKQQHSKCPNTKSPKLLGTKTYSKVQKEPTPKNRNEVDDFWSIEPPQIVRRRVQEQVASSQDYSVPSSKRLTKESLLVRAKPSKPTLMEPRMKAKRMSQPIYDDDDETDFWNANLPESIAKRKQDLLHDSNLWINQLNHQTKNTKLPIISSGPLRLKK